jgi:hypothetical protein
MHTTIHADDGDELSVQACALFDEQAVIRIDLDNRCHNDSSDFDWITLSAEQARELAHALMRAADAVEGLVATVHVN